MIPDASLDSNVYNTANIDFPVKVSHPFVPDLNCLYMAQGKSPLETCNNTRSWKKKTKFTFRGKEQLNQCHCLNLQANNYNAIPRKKTTTKILHCRFKCFEFLKPITKAWNKDPALLITKRCFIIISFDTFWSMHLLFESIRPEFD